MTTNPTTLDPAAHGWTTSRRLPLVRTMLGSRPWQRLLLLLLLAGTAVLYLWDLSASGWANSFYAAAVWAGTRSWTAFLFGSLDPSNFITVDKPPASLWPMELSARIFGFSSWSLLVPQALEGVASVALLYATVRRVSGPVAGLLAGAVLATTPVAALMFRFNNPDALQVLLMVSAAYCTVRAMGRASWRWLALAGVALGLGFLTKMLEAFLVLPALGIAYLWAAPARLPKRLLHLLAAAAAIVVSAGWWVLLVQLWPAGARPYVGGSTNDSELQLALGYNGLQRLFGGAGGGGGRAAGGGNLLFGGAAGLGRLFGPSMGTQISWLLPAALIALAYGLWSRRRAPRTDLLRGAVLVFGGWLVVAGAVFSYMTGIVHPYYTVAMAPPLAALVAIGAAELWRHRDQLLARAVLGLMIAATAAWSWIMLGWDAGWEPWLRWVIVLAAALAVAGLLAGGLSRRRMAATGIAAALAVAGLAAPVAYSLQTAATPHSGSIPTAGPSSGTLSGARGAGPGGSGTAPGGGPAAAGAGAAPGGGATVSSKLASLLAETHTTWAAATDGSQEAAGLELSSGKAVMAIGGFTGSDPAPTLSQFKRDVAEGKIRYYVVSLGGAGGGAPTTSGEEGPRASFPGADSNGSRPPTPSGESRTGGPFPGGGTGSANQITSWVKAHYRSFTVNGVTVYDLSRPTN